LQKNIWRVKWKKGEEKKEMSRRRLEGIVHEMRCDAVTTWFCTADIEPPKPPFTIHVGPGPWEALSRGRMGDRGERERER